MKNLIYKFIFFLLLLGILNSCKDSDNKPINYFNQEIPYIEAQVFSPDIISLPDRWEGNANFSSDGKEFYFNIFDSLGNKSIFWSLYKNSQWSIPVKLEEIGKYDNWEPFISYDCKELLFVSSREPGNPEWNGRIWKSKRNEANEWTEPNLVNLGYETNNGFWFPNYSKKNDKIIYFGGRNIEGLYSKGKGDLYYYDTQLDTIINLETLNSIAEDWDPYISPDESYILWASDRKGGFGGTDIYISFKIEEQWGAPINLGEKVNSPDYEVAPRISSDGKILFFDRPVNGSQDIYWLSSSVIIDLKN